jgi:hypothetical protein
MSNSPVRREREDEEQKDDTRLFNDSIVSTPVQASDGAVREQVANEMQCEQDTLILQNDRADKLRREFRQDQLREMQKQASAYAQQAARSLDLQPDALAHTRVKAKLATLLATRSPEVVYDEFLAVSRQLGAFKQTLEQTRLRITAELDEINSILKRQMDFPTFADLQTVSALLNSMADSMRTVKRIGEEYALSKLMAGRLHAAVQSLRENASKPKGRPVQEDETDDDEDDEEEASSDDE